MFDWQFEIRACSFKLGALGNIFAGANTENYHLRIVKKKWLSLIEHEGKNQGAQSLHSSEPKKAHPTGEFVVVP